MTRINWLLSRLKPWMLPIAMVLGILFHDSFEAIEFIAPYLIFIMLFITFCKVDGAHLHPTRFSWYLLAVQILGGVLVYLALLPFGNVLAMGTFICIFCPTATAAPVITGMLGGSVTRLATFSIVSNIAVAILAPILFTLMGSNQTGDISLIGCILVIAKRVLPVIILPLILALLLRWRLPRLTDAIGSKQSISFYIWAVSLLLVVGRSVSFVMKEPSTEVPLMVTLAIVAGVACVAQFAIGRIVGRRFGDKISGAQGLGQ
ncbi:MAG: transporter, partial [Muribaculaceae bacterium]|nr:transporter [Muribaculaceae bacterium]